MRDLARITAIIAVAVAVSAFAYVRVVEPRAKSDRPLTLQEEFPHIYAIDKERRHVVDGRSNLPGGRASLNYRPLDGQWEVSRKKSVDGPYDDSQWWLLSRSRGTNFMTMEYLLNVPPKREAELRDDLRDDRRGTWPYSGGRRAKYRTEQIGGTTAHTFRYVANDGDRYLWAKVYGRRHRLTFYCRVQPSQAALWKQCRSALRTLRVDF